MSANPRLRALAQMSTVEKKAEWRRLTGRPVPPAFGAGLLTRAIAHMMQEIEAGGTDKALARRIQKLVSKTDRGDGNNADVELRPGTWLSRTWHGDTHEVVVLEGAFEYRGHRYPSLTAIAHYITGAKWSGPRFFGLRSPRLGGLSVMRDG